jgi:hypothetical protein
VHCASGRDPHQGPWTLSGRMVRARFLVFRFFLYVLQVQFAGVYMIP